VKLLILGGTIFLGRYLVEAAQARGHEITLFNRGKHNPDLFPEIEKLRGQRSARGPEGEALESDLSALQGRTWDAVIDTCGYFPRQVREAAEVLAGSVGHYTFISSISAYSSFSQPDMDESGPVGTLEDQTIEQVTGESYGPLKVLCEQAAEQAFLGRALNLRAGLIVGPHDPSDRFTYWPCRVAQGGAVLAPGGPEVGTQFIDVRDLAEWNIRMVEAGKAGVYNATGPDYPMTLGAVLEASKTLSGSDAEFVWADEKWLVEKGVAPWMEMPLWVPSEEEYKGFNSVNCRKAIADGLTFRPVADTVRDTLAWAATRPADYTLRAGMKPEKEAEVLEAWRARV